MSRDQSASGPRDFPFEVGDKVAAYVTGSRGASWFVGELTALGSGGLHVSTPPEVSGYDDPVVLWLPWGTAPVRNVPAQEWADLLADHARRGEQ